MAWVRHRCEAAPVSTTPIEFFSPSWASETTSATPVEAASDETSQERRPARSVLGAYDIDAEDLPVALCVHSRGDDSRQGDESSALAHLVEQGVQPDLGVRPLVQGTIAELGDLDVEVLRELGDLGLGHAVDAHRSHEVVDSSGGDPFDICLADHRD